MAQIRDRSKLFSRDARQADEAQQPEAALENGSAPGADSDGREDGDGNAESIHHYSQQRPAEAGPFCCQSLPSSLVQHVCQLACIVRTHLLRSASRP